MDSKLALKVYTSDAFTSEVFKGNPATVIPLEEFLPYEKLLSIASENHVPATSFIVRNKEGKKSKCGQDYDFFIRWFFPGNEIPLCGHATIATSHVIFNKLKWDKEEIVYNSLESGVLRVKRDGDKFIVNFPAQVITEIPEKDVEKDTQIILSGLNIPKEHIIEIKKSMDHLVVLKSQAIVASIKPLFANLLDLDTRGVVITSEAENKEKYDFVSRVFFPKQAVNEDPVCGSAHCITGVYWSQKLKLEKLRARQISQRGGDVGIEIKGDRAFLSGSAVEYMEGTIYV